MRLKAFTLTELMTVLAIVGILMLVAMPVFDSLFGDAYSIEAKNQLVYLHGRQQSHFQQYFRYSDDFRSIGFVHPETIQGEGTARYAYEIVRAGSEDFLARATAVADFDGDGNLNVWEIDSSGRPLEVIPD